MEFFAKLENDECILRDEDCGNHAENVKEYYLNIYKGIQFDLNYVSKFDETTDKTTTYIGKKTIDRKRSLNLEVFSNNRTWYGPKQTFGWY